MKIEFYIFKLDYLISINIQKVLYLKNERTKNYEQDSARHVKFNNNAILNCYLNKKKITYIYSQKYCYIL